MGTTGRREVGETTGETDLLGQTGTGTEDGEGYIVDILEKKGILSLLDLNAS